MRMKKLLKIMIRTNEDGYTLIETLLVLFIVGCTFAIPVLAIDKMIVETKVDLFFRELTSNITMMQNHSVLNGERTSVRFFNDTNNGNEFVDFNVVLKPDHHLNKRQNLDLDYYHYRNKASKVIYFKGYSGHISESSNVHFRTSTADYTLTFWLGSGRFEIRKSTTG